MLSDSSWEVGRVFAIPLPTGGYAFGYLTHVAEDGPAIGVIFEDWAESPEPPVEHGGIVIRDLLISGAEFRRPGGSMWILTSRRLPRPIRPEARHWRVGDSRRGYYSVDIEHPLGRTRISMEAAIALPVLEVPAVDFTLARIETRIKAVRWRALAPVWVPTHASSKPSTKRREVRKFVHRFAEFGFRRAPSMREFLNGKVDPRLVAYLRHGRLYVSHGSTESAHDVFDPSAGPIGAGYVYTDGTWAWIDTLPYYVTRYGLILPDAFLRYAAKNEWKVPPQRDDGY